MIKLFSSAGCPFAQRTRALLAYLDHPFELQEVDLDDRDPELLELSPTGKVPFLVDGDFRLFESGVIDDYVAEKLGFEGAYSEDVEVRALQKLVMRRWDDLIVPMFYRSLRQPESLDDEMRATISKELGFLSSAVARMGDDVDNLAALHMATHWARMDWVRELTSLAELVDAHPPLRRWLDHAAALPAIQTTLPSRGDFVDRYRKRYAGRQP